MKSTAQSLKFKYLDRGYKETIVLLPGWASDSRIFGPLDLKFNYILPGGNFPYFFEESLLEFLNQNSLSEISLLGWSLGGFVGLEFSAKYPHLIDELILVSIREKYNKESLEKIKDNLKKSKEGFLYKFYKQCFYRKESMGQYKEIFKDLRSSLELSYLFDTLNYLSRVKIPLQSLEEVKKIKIIHGKYDEVAPINEARNISEKLKDSEFIAIDGCGHVPFLETNLAKYI